MKGFFEILSTGDNGHKAVGADGGNNVLAEPEDVEWANKEGVRKDQGGVGEAKGEVEEASEEDVEEANEEDVEEANEEDVEEAKEEDVEEAKEEDVEGAKEEDVAEENEDV